MTQEIKLPDFEDMYGSLEAIKKIGLKKLLMIQAIEETEADIVLTVSTDKKYFIADKPPSMAHTQRTYLVKGIKGELPEMKKQLAIVTAELDYLKMKFDLDKLAIDVWRTQSANERKAID